MLSAYSATADCYTLTAANSKETGSPGKRPPGGWAGLLAGQAALAVAAGPPLPGAVPHAAAGWLGNGH